MDNCLNFFEDYCKHKESAEINNRLLALYRKWYTTWYDGNESKYADLPLNQPALVTCTDAYLDSRIIFFGQEAHDVETHLNGFCEELDNFFVSSSYHYERLIRFDKAKNTIFLKTRKVCAGINPNTKFKDNEPDYRRFTSVLVNNLNKVSYVGKTTPVNERLSDIYSQFEFEGCFGNIYYHEIRILQPKKIVFVTGNYTNHLERDFGNEVANTILNSWKTLYLGNRRNHQVISPESEMTFAGVKMRYIYGYHPSAHLNANDRKTYNEKIKSFVRN